MCVLFPQFIASSFGPTAMTVLSGIIALHRRDVNSNLCDADLLSDLVWEVILLLEEECIRQILQCDGRLNDSDRKE